MKNTKNIKDLCVGLFRSLCIVGMLAGAFAASHTLAAETEAAVEVQVNLNTADLATLATLEGVGEAKAAAIIEWREQNGGFGSVEELAEVKGIGSATLERNRHKLSL